MHYKKTLLIVAAISLIACGGGGSEDAELEEPTPQPIVTPTPPPDVNFISGQALVTWRLPEYRENGDPLLPQEIGGFEIRYREQFDADFTYIVFEGIEVVNYTFEDLNGIYEFEIAAYDNNGLYSQFVELEAMH
ncbi:fibronectin type III domain-containing protein [Simiduia aestuariiviva]|uniref:Fibronectin type-III domain-containing protein n=1 Tax=Simiduia aestuariiviva TaxID=1510459 RepID=A0A839UXB8_9GAMM|nr:fibronectin type III domain-containing protein [Simiduia aestuariiviva]MBB3170098.1 hypothetical protein [Simiduia aestuariiviva]